MSADNEEQKAINNQYDDLKGVIADAARVKTDINSTCKESLKNMKRDFSGFMVDNVADEFKDTAERLGLFNGFADVEDKKKREKKIEGALKSFFGKMFAKSSDFDASRVEGPLHLRDEPGRIEVGDDVEGVGVCLWRGALLWLATLLEILEV